MMRDFDFDEWADLYRQDPQAFEARRQAMLALEIAKHRAHAGPARQMLDAMQARLDRSAEHERLNVAFGFMVDSLARLTREMADLRHAAAQVDAHAARALRH